MKTGEARSSTAVISVAVTCGRQHELMSTIDRQCFYCVLFKCISFVFISLRTFFFTFVDK